jgi:hypothetical protein
MELYFHSPVRLHGVHRDTFTFNFLLCQQLVSRCGLCACVLLCSALQLGSGAEPMAQRSDIKLVTPPPPRHTSKGQRQLDLYLTLVLYEKRTPCVGSLSLRLWPSINCQTACRIFMKFRVGVLCKLKFCENWLSDVILYWGA